MKHKIVMAQEPQVIPNGRQKKQCACGAWFLIPDSHAERHKSCSLSCSRKLLAEKVKARERACAECGKTFVPRPAQVAVGGGRFCSASCSTKAFSKTEAFRQARKASGKTYVESLRAGKFTRPTGEAHPLWKGGSRAATLRQTQSGKAKARLSIYRQKNRIRVREWAEKRVTAKASRRLPKGTVAKKMEQQRGLCVYCSAELSISFHVDHIMPLALGGEHAPSNIQLLCPSCNCKKGAKHPDEFLAEVATW